LPAILSDRAIGPSGVSGPLRREQNAQLWSGLLGRGSTTSIRGLWLADVLARINDHNIHKRDQSAALELQQRASQALRLTATCVQATAFTGWIRIK
jgi:hypothetical protein